MVNSITLRWLFNPFLLYLWLPDSARMCERKIITLLVMWDIPEVIHLHSAPHAIYSERHMCHLGADIQAELENTVTVAGKEALHFKLFHRYWMFDSALSLASCSDGYGMERCRGRAFSPSVKGSAKSIDLCWTRTLCLHIRLSLVLSLSR